MKYVKKPIVFYAYARDFIIKGIKGEIYPCKKDIFNATYETFKEDCSSLDDDRFVEAIVIR